MHGNSSSPMKEMVDEVLDIANSMVISNRSDGLITHDNNNNNDDDYHLGEEEKEQELTDRLDVIHALKNVVLQQRKAITTLRKKQKSHQNEIKRLNASQSRERSTEENDEEAGFAPKPKMVSFGPCLERTDLEKITLDDCLSWSQQNSSVVDETFKDLDPVLVDLHKEVVATEAALTTEHISTISIEVNILKKELEGKKDEIQNLHEELEEQNGVVANLEMEREMYKEAIHELEERQIEAENAKRETALISSLRKECREKDKILEELTIQIRKMRHKYETRRSKSRSSNSDETSAVSTVVSEYSIQEPVADAEARQRESPKPFDDVKTIENPNPNENKEAQEFPIQTQPSFDTISTLTGQTGDQNWDSHSQQSMNSPIRAQLKMLKQKARSASTGRKRSGKENILTSLPFLGKKNPNVPASPVKSKSYSRSKVGRMDDVQSLQAEVDYLVSKHELSQTTIADLRKRLMIVNQHYRNMVRSLQSTIDEVKQSKTKVEMELVNQLALLDHEKRTAIDELQQELDERDEQLSLYKRARHARDTIQVGVIEEESVFGPPPQTFHSSTPFAAFHE